MKVTLIFGANAYAVIKHAAGTMDVLLHPGRSASKSLRESAAEEKAQAVRKIQHAALLEQAADILEWGKK